VGIVHFYLNIVYTERACLIEKMKLTTMSVT